MKLTLVFVFFFCLQSFLPAEAQRISLSGDYTLEKALTQIEKQSGGYTFFYNYELMEKAKPVRINIKNVLLEEALQAVFNNQPFSYSIQNKIIVLRSKTQVADKMVLRLMRPTNRFCGMLSVYFISKSYHRPICFIIVVRLVLLK